MPPPKDWTQADWEREGQAALLDLIQDRGGVITIQEAEARISPGGWKNYQPVQPVQLGAAILQLANSDPPLICDETSDTTPPVRTLRLPDAPGNKRQLARRRGEVRKLHRVYAKWAGDQALCGKHAERIVLASLREAAAEVRLWVPLQRPGNISDVRGVAVPRGPLDALAYFVEFDRVPTPIVGEVKNIHSWIYPSTRELWELLTKAADIATQIQVVPVLFCVRAAPLTLIMAKDIGFFVCPLWSQLFSSDIDETEFQSVVDEFGYKIARHAEEPAVAVVNWMKRWPRADPPPSRPYNQSGQPWYQRQAERFAKVAPVIQQFPSLATLSTGPQRTSVFRAFRTQALAAADWPTEKLW